ncbi:MAG: helix-turn-helix transcriptional regulator, partial [Clostridia bacterium]|nr:helix-turn-helix transcriptional regulator [Clostridia bacterium]
MDYSLKEVAGRIKDLREAKGYTIEELAKLTGVSAEDYRLLEE